MKPNHLVIIGIIAIIVVGLVWYSSARAPGVVAGDTASGGTNAGSLVAAGGALLGGIVNAASGGGGGTVQEPAVSA
jgi:hypothetical protein